MNNWFQIFTTLSQLKRTVRTIKSGSYFLSVFIKGVITKEERRYIKSLLISKIL